MGCDGWSCRVHAILNASSDGASPKGRRVRPCLEGISIERRTLRPSGHRLHRGLGDRGDTLGGARLEELLHTRQTVGDVVTGHTTVQHALEAQPDGSYLTPEGDILTDEIAKSGYLRTVQDWIIRPQMRQVANVAGVDAIGGFVKQYEVAPDTVRLAAAGLSMTDLVDALERGNVSSGAGVVERSGEGLVVRADARVSRGSEIANIVITQRGGAPVRVVELCGHACVS